MKRGIVSRCQYSGSNPQRRHCRAIPTLRTTRRLELSTSFASHATVEGAEAIAFEISGKHQPPCKSQWTNFEENHFLCGEMQQSWVNRQQSFQSGRIGRLKFVFSDATFMHNADHSLVRRSVSATGHPARLVTTKVADGNDEFRTIVGHFESVRNGASVCWPHEQDLTLRAGIHAIDY